MKIKRYQADDMRSAIRIVRNELGSDAVILSNQRIGNQTEVIAAIDYDESLLSDTTLPSEADNDSVKARKRSNFTDDLKYTRNLQSESSTNAAFFNDDIAISEKVEKKLISKIEKELLSKLEKNNNKNALLEPIPAMTDMKKQIRELRSLLITQFSGISNDNEIKNNPLRSTVYKCLIAFGLSSELANEIADATDTEKDFDHNWHHALAIISHLIHVTQDDILSQGGVVALIGATGVGKTTSVAKLAAQFIMRHGKDSVALISTDSYRIAAHEQLRTFSRILNVPMYVATDIEQLKSVLNVVNDKKLVLIDTAGMSQKDLSICNQFKLIEKRHPIKSYLVYAVNSQRSVLEDVSNACADIEIKACIFTKLDETTNLGGAISVCIEKNLPVSYFSDGQKIPDDLHVAFAHSLVSKNVAIMKEAKINKSKFKTQLKAQGMVTHAHG
ncbi:MAG: flagellar biosynthesis protein FlhF [Gammaproteobacteria bacterium]